MSKRWAIRAFVVASIGTIIASSGIVPSSHAQPDPREIRRPPPKKIPTTPQFVEGEVLVQYSEEVIRGKNPSERARLIKREGDRLTSQFGVKVVSTIPELGIQHLKLPRSISPEEAIEKLQADSAVERVEPNYTIYAAGHNSAPPNDPYWLSHFSDGTPDLWGMEKIGMKGAWRLETGSRKVLVAVLDTGIRHDHQDLRRNLWKNPLESGGIANRDDDGNGIKDDTYGASFCGGITTGFPQDLEGHGTHVAGTIGAVGNNETDVVGVNWSTALMAVKVLCDGIHGTLADAVRGIVYAVTEGAGVLNASWTVRGKPFSLGLAIRWANARNVVFVAAAGNDVNDNDTNPVYPASYQIANVIAVAASEKLDGLWNDSATTGSNYGAHSVHIAAPGYFILSTDYYSGSNTITWNSGTSMAVPHVAGCAALLQSRRLRQGLPILRPDRLRERIMQSGDVSPILVGKVKDGKRLNCWKAIR